MMIVVKVIGGNDIVIYSLCLQLRLRLICHITKSFVEIIIHPFVHISTHPSIHSFDDFFLLHSSHLLDHHLPVPVLGDVR